MNIQINKNSNTPIYVQIKNSIKDQIIKEQLAHGFKLPPERKLAESLGVSRNTIVSAYNSLIDEGLVTLSKKPKGYFVYEPYEVTKKKMFSPLAKMIKYNYNEKEQLFSDLFSQSPTTREIPFAGVNVDYRFFHGDTDKYDMYFKLDSHETDRLKENICRLLSKQNIFVNSKSIQIVSETTQAIEYILDLYLKEGDCVIVEEPIIPSTINVFRNRGIKLVCVKMDHDGMNMEDLNSNIKKYNPKFIYTLPTFHNPSTITMSLEKRQELLKIAQHYGVPIIEENSLRDFCYEGVVLPPSLYALDRSKSVLYLDTFNLTFLPGIKTAYIVGPVEPIEMMGRLIVTNQNMVYNIGHAILNEAIEDGTYERRIVKIQEYYREKRDYLCERLESLRAYGLEFNKPKGGLFVWCTLPSHVNERKMFKFAREKGLLYMPGDLFFPFGQNGRSCIRISYSNVSDRQIDEGIKILEEALTQQYT